jgi:Heat induced stress protein YflT
MAADQAAVFGIFASSESAEVAVQQLTAAGFSTQDISVLMSDIEGAKEFAAEKNTNAGEDATDGIGVAEVVGGTLAFLAEAGALAIPGEGPLVAAGPIIARLASSSESGLVGALVGLGIPEYEAKVYDGKIKAEGVMLSIHCARGEEVSKARDLMNGVGAEDIASFEEESIAGLEVEQEGANLDSLIPDKSSPSSTLTNTSLAAGNLREVEAF